MTEATLPDGGILEASPGRNGAEAEDASASVIRRPDRTPLSQRDPVAIARHFAASGYFADAREMSQAVVKIVAGEELGFGPMTAMAGIHIIDGKPALSANLLATCVKRARLPGGDPNPYTYRVSKIEATEAVIRFFERNPEGKQQEIGSSKFTLAMAKRAGLVRERSGWAKFPEAMLFARALTQGVRWFCPDVTAGQPAYTPEELGAEVNEQGEVIALPAPQVVAEAPALDSERVDQLEQGIAAVGMTYKALDLLLGSIGIDGLRAHSAKARRERLESLSAEQVDALEAELATLADSEG